jgi:hypothetical protein
MRRKLFGPKRDEVTTEWRGQRNENNHPYFFTKHCSGHHIKNNEMRGAISTYGAYERCTQGFGEET